MSTTTVKHAYQNEIVAHDYDRERFANFAGRVFDRLEKRALRAMVRQVLSHTPTPSVLDVPCGTGRITELLLQEGLNTTGGDISTQMIDVAQRKLRRFGRQVTFQQLDLDALALPENSFNLVTCIRLFHHLHTDERATVLEQLARVSNRYVIINVSYSSPYYRLRRQVKRCLGQGVSRTSTTWRQLEHEAAYAGLRISSWRFVLPGISEDMIVLLEKASA